MFKLIGRKVLLALILSLLTTGGVYAGNTGNANMAVRGGGHERFQGRNLGEHPGEYYHPGAAYHPEARAYEQGAAAGAVVGSDVNAGIGAGTVIETQPVYPVEQPVQQTQTQPATTPQ